MDEYPLCSLPVVEFPARLREIPQPPTQLFYRGTLPNPSLIPLAVVGSRHYTSYGKQVVAELIAGLKGHNVAIVSGLAIGIDGLAHEAALQHGLYTLAVPGSGLDERVLYPARHKALARKILHSGGGLLSEFALTEAAATWTFPKRNRIMAGFSVATLIIEASEKSGTLITARLTVDYNRELLVVPGSIFSANSAGPHQFLKLGATPVTQAQDIIDILKLTTSEPSRSIAQLPSGDEERILKALTAPLHKEVLAERLSLAMSTLNVLLMKLELDGIIASENDVYRRCL